MKLWSRIHSMLRNLFRKEQVEIQLDEEVRACVTIMTDERIAGGMSASEARRTAMADFGGIEQVKASSPGTPCRVWCGAYLVRRTLRSAAVLA